MGDFQIAQINIARMKGVNIDDPIMKEFTDNLDRVNEIAESSKGFVWRLKDDSNNATSINPYNDVQVLINISVWESIEALEEYTYNTFHTEYLRRRKEWFNSFGKATYAIWWISAGNHPTIEEAMDRLDYLQKNGPTPQAFDFKKRFMPTT